MAAKPKPNHEPTPAPTAASTEQPSANAPDGAKQQLAGATAKPLPSRVFHTGPLAERRKNPDWFREQLLERDADAELMEHMALMAQMDADAETEAASALATSGRVATEGPSAAESCENRARNFRNPAQPPRGGAGDERSFAGADGSAADGSELSRTTSGRSGGCAGDLNTSNFIRSDATGGGGGGSTGSERPPPEERLGSPQWIFEQLVERDADGELVELMMDEAREDQMAAEADALAKAALAVANWQEKRNPQTPWSRL